MVNPSWREGIYDEVEAKGCILADCPHRQQRLACQWEAAMIATPGNECWHPEHRPAWLAAEAEEGKSLGA